MDGIAVRAVLARTPGLRAAQLRALAEAANGDLDRCLEPDVTAQADLATPLRHSLANPDRRALRDDLRWIRGTGTHVLACTDPAYPAQLLDIGSPPAILFVRGDPATLRSAQLAIVGTRSATRQAHRDARRFASAFAQAGVGVVSGLAAGIDACAHHGALEAGGTTIAVCAHGLDRIYPTQHRGLATRIMASGALVSDYAPGTPPRRGNFAARNRLISGLSQGVVVIQTRLKGGSMITVKHAQAQQRRVFAVPGQAAAPHSHGCHQLIRDGATLAEHPGEVLSDLGFLLSNEALAGARQEPPKRAVLDKEYEMLLDALGFEPATPEDLMRRTGFSAVRVASVLLSLESLGRVVPYPDGLFGRIP